MFGLSRPFRDRVHGGRVLGERLHQYANRDDVVVLALPRGGVPVAAEVAAALRAPLDVFVVRKLGTPGHRELAMGAIASGGVRVLNQDVVQMLGVTEEALERAVDEEIAELQRREQQYRQGRAFPDLQGQIVILIDDGLATGSTMRAAAQAVRQHHPAKVVVAAPVGAADTCRELQDEVDAVVCAVTPEPFHAVGLWYEEFDQTSDEEVRRVLAHSAGELVE